MFSCRGFVHKQFIAKQVQILMVLSFGMQEDAYWDAHANPKAKRDAKREEQA
jgi:hypothetical protein